eukprot:2337751-Rhodomonas_salina.3
MPDLLLLHTDARLRQTARKVRLVDRPVQNPLCSYARATPCPVLICGMALSAYVMPGTDRGWKVL